MKSLPKQRKCITIRVLILTVVIALLFWIGSLIKCEVLTNRYEIEFQELYKDNIHVKWNRFLESIRLCKRYRCEYTMLQTTVLRGIYLFSTKKTASGAAQAGKPYGQNPVVQTALFGRIYGENTQTEDICLINR